MKFYGIDVQGEMLLEVVTSLPSFDSDRDYRRLVYNSNDGKLYYGKSDRWSILGAGTGEGVTDFTSGGTMYTSKVYMIDTTTTSKQGTLTNTNIANGDVVSVLDVGDNFATNSFTVNAGSGDTIDSAASFTCNANGGFYQFIYYASSNDWKPVAQNDITTFTIDDLADISSASPSDDDVLQYNSATGKYEPTSLSGGTGDDTVYGLVRYQASPPAAADEVVYVDSDDDTFYIYDAASASWKAISGGTGTATATASGGELPLLMPDDFSLDDTDTDISRGTAFSMVETLDFGASSDGAAWITFHFPADFNDGKDINMSLIYNLSGSDNSKTLDIDTSYWCYGNAETPDSNTPDATNSDSIGSDTSQGKRRTKSLSSIPSSAITDGDTVTLKVKRKGSSDTYSGTLQMLYLYVYQN